jgi:hypothetical protein
MVKIDDIVVDIAISEDHTFENEVTSHPVETGSDVTDNSIVKPDAITLDCIISNTPLTTTGREVNDQVLASSSPADEARAKLLALRQSREPITVIDSLGTWTDMVLEHLSIPRSSRTGDALAFKATFKKLVIVTNERATVPVAIPRAESKIKRGTRPSKSPPENSPPAAAEDHRTALHKLLSKGASRFGYILPGDPGNPTDHTTPAP